MWSSWVERNGTTQVMYIVKLKNGSKRAKKTFSIILERIFEMVWWRGEKMESHKNDIFEVEVFFSSRNIGFPYIWRDSLSFSFSSSFSLFSFFYALSLEDLGVLIIFEEKITSSKTSF
jgi:hypothetical protein